MKTGNKNSLHRSVQFLKKYFYALGAAAYLFTLGLGRTKHRALISSIAAHFGWNSPAVLPPMAIPGVTISDLISESVPIVIREPEVADGNISIMELIVISRLIQHRKPTKIFEIGTFDGRTTLNLAANAPPHSVVFTLDLPEASEEPSRAISEGDRKFTQGRKLGARFLGKPEAGRIKQLLGDSAHFDFSPYRHSVDLIFIDGAHSCECVLNDSKSAREMLAENGIILWHDYSPSWEGAVRALNELYASGGIFKNLRHITGTSLVILEAGVSN